MSMLREIFNAAQVDPTQGAGQMPLGRHPVVITESEIKANKDNQGGHLALGLRVIEGPNAGQTGAYRLNLYHADARTAEIAQRQLSALCHVTGVLQLQDTQALHNIPFVVEVTQQKLTAEQQQAQAAGQQVTPYTQVSKVFYMDGREPGKEGQAPAQAQPMAAAPAAAPAGGAWGGAPGPAAPAPAPAGGAWAGGGAPAPAGPPAAAPAAGAWGGAAPVAPAGAWQQGAAPAAAAAPGKPAWGR